MHDFNFLDKLLHVEPTEAPFVSIYLNAEPNATGRKDFDVFLKKQFNDHAAVLDEGTVRRDCFDLDRQKGRQPQSSGSIVPPLLCQHPRD